MKCMQFRNRNKSLKYVCVNVCRPIFTTTYYTIYYTILPDVTCALEKNPQLIFKILLLLFFSGFLNDSSVLYVWITAATYVHRKLLLMFFFYMCKEFLIQQNTALLFFRLLKGINLIKLTRKIDAHPID